MMRQAESALAHGEVDRACELLSQTRQQPGGDLYSSAYTIQAYARWDRPKKALASLERAIQAESGRADLHRLRGHLIRRSGDLKVASAELVEAQRLSPGEPRFAFEALLSRLSTGERGAHLREAAASLTAPASNRVSSLLAAFDGDKLTAAQAVAESEQPVDRLIHAVLLLARGETERALPALESLAADARLPRAARGYASFYTGVAYTQLQQPEPAIEALESARSLGASDHLVRSYLSWAYQQMAIEDVLAGNLADAVQWFEKLEKMGVEGAAARENAAYALSLQGQERAHEGNYDEAAELWSQALAIRPDDFELRQNLAVALERAERTEEAIPHWHELVRRLPRPGGDVRLRPGSGSDAGREDPLRLHLRAVAHRHLADLYLEQDEASRAIEQLDLALKADPSDVEARRTLARLLVEEGRAKKAIPHFERVVAEEPNSVDDHLELGMAYISLENEQQGISHLETVLSLQPEHPAARSILVMALVNRVLRSPKADTAVDDALRSMVLVSDRSAGLGHLALGATQIALGDSRNAQKSFKEAIRLAPDKTLAAIKVGEVYWQAGERAAAEKSWADAMKKAKKNPKYYIALAEMWAMAGNADLCRVCLMEALKRCPSEDAIDSVERMSRSRGLQPILRQVLQEAAAGIDDPLELVDIAEMLVYAGDAVGARTLLNRVVLEGVDVDDYAVVTAALDLDVRYRLLDKKTSRVVADWLDADFPTAADAW